MTRPKQLGGLGFRDLELFNLALLARQAWRILQEPATLSAQILKASYFPEKSILEAELGSRPSQIWRAIIEGPDVLKQGFIRRIGNGRTTDIWNDNWIPKETIPRPITSLVAAPPRRVSELLQPAAAAWNVGLVRLVFLPFDADAILKIPVCTRNFWTIFGLGTGIAKEDFLLALRTIFWLKQNWKEKSGLRAEADHLAMTGKENHGPGSGNYLFYPR